MNRENSSYIHHPSLSLYHSYEFFFYSQLLAIFLSWSSHFFFLENSIGCISSHNKDVNRRGINHLKGEAFLFSFLFFFGSRQSIVRTETTASVKFLRARNSVRETVFSYLKLETEETENTELNYYCLFYYNVLLHSH